MRSLRLAVLLCTLALVGLLGVLTWAVGLSGGGWVAGLGCLFIVQALLSRGLLDAGASSLGAANAVTLARATLVAGVTALTVFQLSLGPLRETPLDGHHIADFLPGAGAEQALVALAVVALVLDGVDGQVARRTESESALGARFDMELDAFLILVLSVQVAHATDRWWVLAIGCARYAFLAAAGRWSWLASETPPRRWGKWVAAIQGIVLTTVAADVLPRTIETVLLVVALVLLAESFVRQIAWLVRHRPVRSEPVPSPNTARGSTAEVALTVLAASLVWATLVTPVRLAELTPRAFVSVPLEGLLLVALALVLPVRWRGRLAIGFGSLLGLLAIVKLLDWGFFEVFDRPFDPVNDWGYLGPGLGVVQDSLGTGGAVGAALLGALLVIALPVLVVLSCHRLVTYAARHQGRSRQTVAALGIVWTLCAVFGVALVPRIQVASTSSADLVGAQVDLVYAGLEDRGRFAEEITQDSFADSPDDGLLSGLKGKDVLIVVVESYGRVALEDSSFSGGVTAELDTASEAAPSWGVPQPQRLPHLTDVRCRQLARPCQPAVRALGGQPAALQPAARQQPPDPDLGVRQCGLAHSRRPAGRHPRLARRAALLRLRPRLRLPRPGLPRPPVQLCHDAGPVHPGRPAAA